MEIARILVLTKPCYLPSAAYIQNPTLLYVRGPPCVIAQVSSKRDNLGRLSGPFSIEYIAYSMGRERKRGRRALGLDACFVFLFFDGGWEGGGERGKVQIPNSFIHSFSLSLSLLSV